VRITTEFQDMPHGELEVQQTVVRRPDADRSAVGYVPMSENSDGG